MAELRAIWHEWQKGGGDLLGLLWSWFEVVSGRIKVDETYYTSVTSKVTQV